MRPRVLFVGRTRYRLPLDASLAPKWDALAQAMEIRVLARAAERGAAGDPRFRLARPLRPRALDGAAFYVMLPVLIARELRDFRPHAVLAQGGHETAAVLAGRALARVRTAVIADVHGDWRAPTRLYGSRLRAALNPVADLVAERALRSADGVRTVTAYSSTLVRGLGLEPVDEFPAYMDFAAFLSEPVQPLPERPQALFVGVLERYKNVDGLAEAWRAAAPRAPGASLRIVGSGTLRRVVEQLVRDLPEQTSWSPLLPQRDVGRALDESTFLVLPSRSEGMGRVIVEAFCRGRPVVGSRVGGIPDVVDDGVNGLLVDPGDGNELRDALVRLLTDRALAERLAAGARESAARWVIAPEEFAGRLRALVERVAG